MAICHISCKTVSHATGRTAPAAAAYRAGDRLKNEMDGRTHDYSRRAGVLHAEIIVPDGTPMPTRQEIWNAAEIADKRKNSTVAREWEIALPSELSEQERRALALAFGRWLCAEYGVVADVAVHAPNAKGDQRNHHAHILTTTRTWDGKLGAKTRIFDAKETGAKEVAKVRAKWEQLCNRSLALAGRAERISAGRLPKGQIATIHVGVKETAITRRGGDVVPAAELSSRLYERYKAERERQAVWYKQSRELEWGVRRAAYRVARGKYRAGMRFARMLIWGLGRGAAERDAKKRFDEDCARIKAESDERLARDKPKKWTEWLNDQARRGDADAAEVLRRRAYYGDASRREKYNARMQEARELAASLSLERAPGRDQGEVNRDPEPTPAKTELEKRRDALLAHPQCAGNGAVLQLLTGEMWRDFVPILEEQVGAPPVPRPDEIDLDAAVIDATAGRLDAPAPAPAPRAVDRAMAKLFPKDKDKGRPANKGRGGWSR